MTRPKLEQAAVLLAALLGGCGEYSIGLDQCMRREIFARCVDAAKGVAGVSGDAISACESAAAYQSKRKESLIAQECQF